MSAAPKLPAISDVSVYFNGTGGAIYCTHAGLRWHFNTADRQTVEPGSTSFYATKTQKRPTLYKHPPKGSRRGDKGFFDTRRLDASVAANRALVEAMFAAVAAGNLWRKTEIAQQAQESKREAEARVAYLELRKQRAGPKLYDALRAMLDATPGEEQQTARFVAHDLLAHVDDVNQPQEYAE